MLITKRKPASVGEVLRQLAGARNAPDIPAEPSAETCREIETVVAAHKKRWPL